LNIQIKIRVKCISSTCALSENQIATLVFKNITNSTCGYQINPLGTSVRILLVFFNGVPRHPYTWRGTCGFKEARGMLPEFLDTTLD
jgi:hypothetical protein